MLAQYQRGSAITIYHPRVFALKTLQPVSSHILEPQYGQKDLQHKEFLAGVPTNPEDARPYASIPFSE